MRKLLIAMLLMTGCIYYPPQYGYWQVVYDVPTTEQVQYVQPQVDYVPQAPVQPTSYVQYEAPQRPTITNSRVSSMTLTPTSYPPSQYAGDRYLLQVPVAMEHPAPPNPYREMDEAMKRTMQHLNNPARPMTTVSQAVQEMKMEKEKRRLKAKREMLNEDGEVNHPDQWIERWYRYDSYSVEE